MTDFGRGQMEQKNLLEYLSKTCRQTEKVELDSNQITEIWNSIIQIAETNIKSFFLFIQYLECLVSIVPTFSESNPQKISELIAKLTTDKNDIHTFEVLMALFPFISESNAKSLINSSIDFIDINNFDQYVSYIDTIEAASINQKVYEEAFSILKTKSETDKIVSSTIFFAPLASAFIDHIDGSSYFFLNLLSKLFKGDKPQIISACFLSERISYQFGQNPQIIPTDLFDNIYNLLLHDDKSIQYRAHKSLRRLIECGVFDTPEYISRLIEQFPKYPTEERNLFFKLILKFLDDTESADINTFKPIFEFAITKLKSDIEIDGFLLPIFAFFCSINERFISDILKDCLLTIHQIVLKQKTNFYANAIELLYVIADKFGENKISIFSKDVEIVADYIISNETTSSPKEKAAIAQSLSSLTSFNFGQNIVPKLINFVFDNIKNAEKNIIFCFCTIIYAIMNKLNEQQIIDLQKEIEILALKETNNDILNALLDVLNKLSKQNPLTDLTDFVQKIINGQLSITYNLPIYSMADSKSIIFHFIKSYIKRNLTNSQFIILPLIKYSSIVPSWMITSIIEPLTKAFELNLLNDNEVQELSDSLIELIPSFDMYSEITEEPISVFNLLTKICNRKSEHINSIKIIELIEPIIIKSDSDEEEPMVTDSLVSAMNLYCSAVTISNKFNVNALISIIESIPFPKETNVTSNIISSLLKLKLSKDNFGDAYEPLLKAYAYVYVMDKQELANYNINEEQIAQIKEVVRNELVKDPKLERELTKDFSRTKINRFKNVYKK